MEGFRFGSPRECRTELLGNQPSVANQGDVGIEPPTDVATYSIDWISGTRGRDVPKLVVRKFRLAPNTSTQSACSAIRRATECENDPMMPKL